MKAYDRASAAFERLRRKDYDDPRGWRWFLAWSRAARVLDWEGWT